MPRSVQARGLAPVDLDDVQRAAAGVGDEPKGDRSAGELVGDRDRERRARPLWTAIAPVPDIGMAPASRTSSRGRRRRLRRTPRRRSRRDGG